VAEIALAHAIPDAVEAAYRRGDLFDKRRGSRAPESLAPPKRESGQPWFALIRFLEL
jgi:hypothetical protein